jgi:hypothetical protein
LYATRQVGLLRQEIPAVVVRRGLQCRLLSPLLYGAGTTAAFASRPLAWAIFVAVPILYITPGVFDRHAPRLADE